MDEIERLRERNKTLKHACQTMALLLSGMMKAAAEDNPELLKFDHFVKGQKQFEELSLFLREIEGEG